MGIAELDFRQHDQQGDDLWLELKEELIDPCKVCGGSGSVCIETSFVEDIIPISKSKLCTCRQTALDTLNMQEAGVPKEFWKADLIKPTFNIDRFDELRRFGRNLNRAFKHGLGFLLTGENGSGKSSSACIPIIEALRSGYDAAFINWPDLIRGYRKSMANNELAEHLDKRVARKLVVLDEVSKERVGNDETFVQSHLDSILRMRRGSMLSTIVTTNLEYEDFLDRYGSSVGSLLSDRFKVLVYEPGDFRVATAGNWDELLGK